MNIREFILPALLAMATMFALQYFFSPKEAVENPARPGSSFVAPTNRESAAPLNKEVDFLDKEKVTREERTEIRFDEVTYVFSTAGATLDRVSFKRELRGRPGEITTVFPGSPNDRERKCFLVALDKATPFGYQLVHREDLPERTDLMYRSVADTHTIEKKFTVYKNTYRIGMALTLAPKGSQQAVQARILYPSPLMPDIEDADTVSAVISNEQGAVKKIARNKLVAGQGWFAPWLFGADNKYFAHFMVADPQSFAQRCYYNLLGKNEIISILEGPVVTEKTTWNVDFYLGPKEEDTLKAIDPRLVDILDYSGWLAPVSRVMLQLLQLMYNYLHNYGLAIILLTLLIKLLLLPFTLRTERNLKAAAAYRKKLAYIEQKYKHDREALAQAKLAFAKEHGLSGMGLSGCLPLLIQVPMFFGLSRVLSSSIEFYQVSFLWIPDLAARDPWFILPVIVALSIFMKSALAPKDQRTSTIVSGLVFGAFTANFSAGLALYFAVSSVFDWLQSYIGQRVRS